MNFVLICIKYEIIIISCSLVWVPFLFSSFAHKWMLSLILIFSPGWCKCDSDPHEEKNHGRPQCEDASTETGC